MTTEETIFAEALAKPSAAERAAYLDQACAGDARLRSDVESLLLVQRKVDGILDCPPPSLSPAAEFTPPFARVGATVGPYKLLEQIGGGGMGAVFMAEQTDPVRRKVALKVIKPGFDTRQVIARFEAERQALAMMDHPNIAKVFDAGMTDAGRPYFVMELVKGLPITDYCDHARLTTRQRLELFVQVCHAVQHAHQKGIIHRDLKPANVLVTLHDDEPVPKVIDFGIAKATGQVLTDKTLFTNYAQMLGTPMYMSPEQAQISGLDVDTRSDVYSLGVLLYELLTGTTPFDKQRLREAAFDEMRRIIREEEPPKPSTRLSTSDALPTIAANRGLEPKKLSALVRGELDWIVMKTLEKDRTRRYETANGFARDVERYLRDEPVQACPPTGLYRFRKFVRRHKGPVAAAAAVLLALILGVAAATAGFLQANRERVIAEENEDRADRESRNARVEADKAKAVTAFLADMLESANPGGGWERIDPGQSKGKDVTVYELLSQAARRLDAGSLKDRPEIEGSVRTNIGFTFYGLGQMGDAEKQFREALRLHLQVFGPEHKDVAGSMVAISRTLPANKLNERETLLRQALAMQRKLFGDENEEVAESLLLLADLLRAQGRLAEAEAAARQGLALEQKLHGADSLWAGRGMFALADVLRNEWKLDEAERLYTGGLALERRHLGHEHPATLVVLTKLAELRQLQGKTAEAERLFREVLAKQKRPVPWTLGELAKLLHAQGKFAEAEPLYRRALEIDTDLLGSDDPLLGRRMILLAEVLQAQKKHAEAESLYRRALAHQRRVLGDADSNARSTLKALTTVLREEGKLAEAEPLYREMLAGQQRLLGADHPTVADTMSALAGVLTAVGRSSEAAELDRRAGAIRAAPRPASTSRADVAAARLQEADALIKSGSYAEAEALLLELRLRGSGDIRAKARDKLIEIYKASGKPEKACELLGQRVQSAKKNPGSGRVVKYQVDYAQSLTELARFEPAEAVLKEAYAAATEAQKPLVGTQFATLYDAWGKPQQAAEWRAKHPLAATAPSTAPARESRAP